MGCHSRKNFHYWLCKPLHRKLPISFCSRVKYLFNLFRYDVYNPRTTENGPAKWSFTKNLYERPVLLRQNSRIKDSGTAGELSLAIIKSIFVRKKAFFKVEYRASNSGVVGFVFKYLDNDNYFLFEIGGGDDVAQRYLQVRKKLTGVWSLVKRYNRIEEIPTLPFFGYDPESWYEISIELLNESIKIFGGIKGTTKDVLIFEFSDNSIPYGRVGFATSGTEAVFADINVYPTPIIYCKFLKIIIFSWKRNPINFHWSCYH